MKRLSPKHHLSTHLLLHCLLQIIPSFVYSQEFEFDKSFANTQGIKQSKVTFYDSEGYSISVEKMDYKFNEKGIAKTKKRYNIPKKLIHTDSSKIPGTYIFNTIDNHENYRYDRTYYFTHLPDGKIQVTGFLTYSDRIIAFEEAFLRLIIADSIPESVFTPHQIGTIQFAGRDITLGPACRWMDVRNVQCPNLGQMSWSEFSDSTRAAQFITQKKAQNAGLRMGETLEDIEVDVIFEGQKIKAIKRSSKIKVPRVIMGGSNTLIIYYLVSEVRERFVGGILSHYTDDVNAKNLPPLLAEVMQL